ncbi:Eukaryotic translation initiation factor 4B, partial [Cryomyces antarcticus]
AEKPSAANNALESGDEIATGDSKSNGKENGASAPAPGKRYEILLNKHEENGDAGSLDANEDEINGSANGNIIGDKDVKPQEIVRDIPKDKAWRQDKASPSAESGPTAEGLEEDGWATVPSKPRNNRKGPSSGRALAS